LGENSAPCPTSSPAARARERGGHHSFARAEVEEISNLQPKGRDAKAHQVKQVRAVIV